MSPDADRYSHDDTEQRVADEEDDGMEHAYGDGEVKDFIAGA
jgi:hypothetical protein